MAGFFDFNTIGRARDRFVEMSKFGMRWDDLMIKNSQAIGYIEGELKQRLGSSLTTDDLMKYSMAISDTTSKLRGKTLAFFQLDYLISEYRCGFEVEDFDSSIHLFFFLRNKFF